MITCVLQVFDGQVDAQDLEQVPFVVQGVIVDAEWVLIVPGYVMQGPGADLEVEGPNNGGANDEGANEEDPVEEEEVEKIQEVCVLFCNLFVSPNLKP